MIKTNDDEGAEIAAGRRVGEDVFCGAFIGIVLATC